MKFQIRSFALGLVLLNFAAGMVLGAPQKIGVLMKGKSDFWTIVEKGAMEAGKAGGAEILVKTPALESDIGIQIRLLNVLVDQGIQALVIAPGNKDALASPVADAAAKGVKIVVIDSPLSGTAASTIIGTNHRAAGEAAGSLLAGLIQNGDEISILKHNQGGGATEEREVGAIEKLRSAHTGLVIHGDIYAGTEKGLEVEKSKLLLTKYPKTKAILASSTVGTMAMLKALEEMQLSGQIKLVGFGFNLNTEVVQAMEKGTLSGWVAQLPLEVGKKGIESALALLAGKQVPPVIYTDFVVITKDNINDPKVQALLKL